jgi:hypothetical protein
MTVTLLAAIPENQSGEGGKKKASGSLGDNRPGWGTEEDPPPLSEE